MQYRSKMKQFNIKYILLAFALLFFAEGFAQLTGGDGGTLYFRDKDNDGYGNDNDSRTSTSPLSGYVTQPGDLNDNNKWITNVPPKYFYKDGDGDGFGVSSIKVYRSYAPTNYVAKSGDCNDSNIEIHPNTVWYRDGDNDTWGNANVTKKQCTQPSGYIRRAGDHNDGTANITNVAPRYFYHDNDKDTFGNPHKKVFYSHRPSGYVTNANDCNDWNPEIHPNTVWYKDGDKDGFGHNQLLGNGPIPPPIRQCSQPASDYVLNKSDYHDNNEFITDIAPRNFYRDADRDTYGNPQIKYYRSFPPQEDGYLYVTNDDDYDDGKAWITNVAPRYFYRDVDNDTYGNPATVVYRSYPPTDEFTYVTNGQDCHDNKPEINPNTVWYKDGDNDTWGDPNVTKTQCSQPTGYILMAGDLKDDNEFITNIPRQYFYRDSDTDTFGDPNIKYFYSIPPDNDGYVYVTNGNDYDDTTRNITNITPQFFYLDQDHDTFGDPDQRVYYSNQPTDYVANKMDKCPGVFGELEGCPFTPHEVTLSDENYVFVRAYQEPMTAPTQIQYNKDVIEHVTYFDGLGRAKQQRAIKASPDEKDIVTHMEYDAYGRQAKQYLPFESDAVVGSYTSVDITNDINTYYKNSYGEDFTNVDISDINAYAESVFEASPLNRVLKQAAPGKDWKADPTIDTDHTIKSDWQTNKTAEEIIRFKVRFPDLISTDMPSLEASGTYKTGDLYKTITKDENWQPGQAYDKDHTTEEYTDKRGQVVLKRTFNENIAHDTYYVYDGFGNRTYVIPPKVDTSDGISNSELAELCYQYKYDYRNRPIAKKIPGKGWEYMVYNLLDQPILSQDANLQAQGVWLFTKYDALGREAYTGKINDTRSREALQTEVDNYAQDLWVNAQDPTTIGGVTMYYDDGGYPKVTTAEVLTINYYDTYDFDDAGLSNPVTVYGVPTSNRTQSLPTGSKIKVLDTDKWITTVTYYDQKGRPIYVASNNDYLNTIDIVESTLDFVGRPEETTTRHTKDSNAVIVTIDTYTYDHMGRLIDQIQKINDQEEELIASNTYDAIGQLTGKKVGGAVTPSGVEGLQTIDYTYNVRGWLKAINDVSALGDDLFAYGIHYNTTTENLGARALYNGNISETTWKTANDNTKRAYGYQYDALNRIIKGISSDGKYDLSSVIYDKQGNILALQRKGATNEAATLFGTIDDLTYNYFNGGNMLQSVADGATASYGFGKRSTTTHPDYDYDDNGNMIVDPNKGITGITYNHLNLPVDVVIDNTDHNGNIRYIYDATGARIQKIVTEGSSLTTDYAGNYVYKQGQLEFFNHPEGIVEKEADGYKYVYQFKDHLDNVRLSYSDKNRDGSITQDEIVQEKNYYPFGLTHRGYNTILRGRNHTYGFNGKEENEELGLAWLDFSARNYDPALGRWMNIDPLAEEMTRHSPYNYAFDNPVFFTDPDGMEPQPTGAYGESLGNIAATTTYYDASAFDSGRSSDPPNKYKQYFDAKSQEYGQVLADLTEGTGGLGTEASPFKLDPVVIKGVNKNNFPSEFAWTGNSTIDYGLAGAYRDKWNKHFAGFAENFDAGWESWNPGDLGYDVMHFTSVAIGGTIAGVAGGSIIGSYAGYGSLGSTISNGYASFQAYGTYYYTYANIYATQKLSYIASGAVLSAGRAIGPTYVRYTPRPIMRFMYNKGVHSFLRNPIKINTDIIGPALNILYGQFKSPYLDTPFAR